LDPSIKSSRTTNSEQQYNTPFVPSVTGPKLSSGADRSIWVRRYRPGFPQSFNLGLPPLTTQSKMSSLTVERSCHPSANAPIASKMSRYLVSISIQFTIQYPRRIAFPGQRAPPATRTRARWQPYNSLRSLSARSSPKAYLLTPASSVSSASPTPPQALAVCENDRLRYAMLTPGSKISMQYMAPQDRRRLALR